MTWLDPPHQPPRRHENGIEPKRFTAICPGPNIAYFSRIVSLSEMIGHIYGRINLLNGVARPNMFIKELQLNVEYFVKEVKKIAPAPNQKQIEYVNEFKKNLLEGIEYYRELFPKMIEETEEYRTRTLAQLQEFKERLELYRRTPSPSFPPLPPATSSQRKTPIIIFTVKSEVKSGHDT